MAYNTLAGPAFSSVPAFERTNGDIAADLGAQLGWPPDGNQRAILDAIYAENTPGIPACYSVCVIAPRQSLKTAVYVLAALTDLFVFGEERVIWTAHKYDTAIDTFEKMCALIENNDFYRSQCRKPKVGNGKETIELLTGQKIEFHARSKGAGRGLDSDRVMLDEGLFLRGMDMGALLPTTTTRPAAQIRYGSSAGMIGSDVLRGLRDRGRKGDDPQLAYFEWTAPRVDCETPHCPHVVGTPGCALDDEGLWRAANPALGVRTTIERLRNLRLEMPADEFMREYLTWWEDPPPGGGALDVELWASLAAQPPELNAPAFGVDLDEAGTGYFAVAWRRPDGLVHVQLAGRTTASKLEERATELAGKYGGRVFAGGPAAGLLADCEPVSSAEFAAACRRFADLLPEIRHSGEPELNEAVGQAKWRTASADGATAWQLKDVPGIGPLAAATRALHGLVAGPSVYESRGLTVLGSS